MCARATTVPALKWSYTHSHLGSLCRTSMPTLSFFFFNDTATTEIYTLSLHDALPIYARQDLARGEHEPEDDESLRQHVREDRKSTRLNSSHSQISYAVFCLKKKTAFVDRV